MRKFAAGIVLGAVTFLGGWYVGWVGEQQREDLQKVETAETREIKTVHLEGVKLNGVGSAYLYASQCGGYIEIEVAWENPDITVSGCDQ